ncbi:hypothetical protein HWV62_26530 [Athelia sp. TMB]|nr:hypothetical protein HWV62_26530 [Athelia sp. TMB]
MRHINEERRQRGLGLSKRLDDIGAEKHALVLQLKSLDAEVKAIHMETRVLHNLNAPTSDIPDEVLVMIFETAVQDERNSPSQWSLLTCPTFISHVSHRWRSIILATPSLWTDIQCFRVPRKVQGASSSGAFEESTVWEERKGWREQAAAHLSRSASMPLRIHLRELGNAETDEDFFQFISAQIPRCRELSVESTHSVARLFRTFALQPTLPLRSLQVVLDPQDKPSQTVFQEPLFPAGAPHLVTAHLGGFCLADNIRIFLSAIAAVTSLRLTNVDLSSHSPGRSVYNEFRTGLMGLAALSHLELDGVFFDLRTAYTLPIVLPNLHFLYLRAVRPYGTLDIIQAIRSIHAPALVTLALTSHNSELYRLSELHFPALKHLILVSKYNRFPNLDMHAPLFSQIERVSLADFSLDEGDGVDTVLMSVFGSHQQQGHDSVTPGLLWRWPNLKIIAIQATIYPKFQSTRSAMCNIIRMLQGSENSLQKLMLPRSLLETVDADAKERLEKVVEIEEVSKREDFYDDWPQPFTIRREGYVFICAITFG